MERMYRAMAVLALASTPSIAHGQAVSACVTRAEANALFVNSIPDMIDGVRKKCAATLPANAFLASQGQTLVARYRAAPPADWSLAKSGFAKMLAGRKDAQSKLMAALPDEALKGLFGMAVNLAITEKVKEQDCPSADRFIAALSPLPPTNIATIVTEIMVLSSKDGGGFKICPES